MIRDSYVKTYRWRFRSGVDFAGRVVAVSLRHLLRDNGDRRQRIRLFLLHRSFFDVSPRSTRRPNGQMTPSISHFSRLFVTVD